MIVNATSHLVVVGRPLASVPAGLDGDPGIDLLTEPLVAGAIVLGSDVHGEPWAWEVIRSWPGVATEVRVISPDSTISMLDGIPVATQGDRQLQGLPPELPDTFLIVSGIAHAAARASGRADTLAPDTGPSALRYRANPQRILAVQRLLR